MIPFFIVLGSSLAILSALPMVRMVAGPTVPDRMVALDAVSTMVVLSMLCFGLGYESVIYVDVAIVYTILAYITTLFIAKYSEGGL